MTTYSQDLRLSLIADGTQVGTWGDTTNANLGTLIEQAIAGVSGGPSTTGTYPSITMPSDDNYALTANNGAVDQARNAVIVINSTPTLSQTRYIIAPAGASKVYIVKNSTSGSQAIAMSYGTTSSPTGAAVSVANGTTSIVYGDGTNFYGVSASGGGGGGSSIAINEQAFVATAGQTVFNLTSFTYTPGINSLQVYVNGLKQVLGEAYTETSTTSFTFVTGLNDGAIVEALGGAALAQSISALNVAYNEGGTGAVTTTVQAKLQESVSVKDFGAVGDGTTDDTAAIQAAMNAGAGNKVYIPAGTYKITNTIFVSSGTFVEWAGTFVVYGIDASYQCAITGNTGVTNITYFNPQINLNSYVPASGILVGTNQDQVRIIGGLIQNGLNSTSQTGGRGISIEQGASATVPSNTTVTGTNIMNCFEGISLSGGTGQEKNNVSISNLTISGCQSAIGFFGNAAGYPHAGNSMQFTLSNISIRNCGIQTVYGQSAGVINSNRGSNILLSNIYCFNDSSYGTVGSFWRGDAANVKMINCTFEGNTSIALLDFSSYQESSSYPLSAYSSTGSDFTTITQKGTSPIVINLPISSASYLTNCRFDLITQTITSGAPCTTNTDNKTTCYMTIQNSTSNAIIEGYLSDIHSGTTFAQYANMQYFASQIGVARAFGVFAGSTGTLNHGLNATVTRTATGTYTVAFANPLPTTGYAVFVQATPTNTTNVQVDYAANIANTGFTIYTYSNNALVDKSLVNFSVFY